MLDGCDHPKQDLTLTPSNSMYGGYEAYCSACGDRWHMTERQYQARQQEPAKPVLMCSCGKVLENPRAYAAHCAEAPDHFTKSE